MSTCLVTGCAGFIGSHLVDRLLDEGHTVLGIDSFEDYYSRELKEANIAPALQSDDFSLVEANLLDLAESAAPRLPDLVGRAEYVFHLAAQPGVRASWGTTFRTYTDNNVLATQVLLEACKGASTDRFVYASSSSVYGNVDELPMREDMVCRPYSPYGVTKLAGEHLASLYWNNFGLPTVSLRFFTVYGPRQRPDMAFRRFIRAALAGEPIPVYGDGSQTRDFTYVGDIVDGIVASLRAESGTVANLAGGSRVSVSEAIDTLAAVLGREIVVRAEKALPGDVRDTLASTSAARAFGYEPRVTLHAGLASESEWLEGAVDPL